MFQRVVLEKEANGKVQKGVLWGVTHDAPEENYAPVQKDIDASVAKGEAIFLEGVTSVPRKDRLKLTKNGRRLRRLMGPAFTGAVQEALARRKNNADQKQALSVPASGITADLTADEVAIRCDEAGLRLGRFAYATLLLAKSERKGWKKAREFFDTPRGKRLYMIVRPLVKWGGRRLMDVRHEAVMMSSEWRNEAAVRAVKESVGDRDFLLIYGSAHIDSLVALLEKEGWARKDDREEGK